jgi:hypothetical protein
MRLDAYLSKSAELKTLYDMVKQAFSERGLVHHDWNHVQRDLAMAVLLGEAEKADMKIVLAACCCMTSGGFIPSLETTTMKPERRLPPSICETPALKVGKLRL